MDKDNKWPLVALAATTASIATLGMLYSSRNNKNDPEGEDIAQVQNTECEHQDAATCENVLVGDIGGTNIRLKIVKIYPYATIRNATIKELTSFSSQNYDCFEDCLK